MKRLLILLLVAMVSLSSCAINQRKEAVVQSFKSGPGYLKIAMLREIIPCEPNSVP
jgi:hypothetical protein